MLNREFNDLIRQIKETETVEKKSMADLGKLFVELAEKYKTKRIHYAEFRKRWRKVLLDCGWTEDEWDSEMDRQIDEAVSVCSAT